MKTEALSSTFMYCSAGHYPTLLIFNLLQKPVDIHSEGNVSNAIPEKQTVILKTTTTWTFANLGRYCFNPLVLFLKAEYFASIQSVFPSWDPWTWIYPHIGIDLGVQGTSSQDIRVLRHTHSQVIRYLSHKDVCLDPSWICYKTNVSQDTRSQKIKVPLTRMPRSVILTDTFMLFHTIPNQQEAKHWRNSASEEVSTVFRRNYGSSRCPGDRTSVNKA